MSIKNFKFILIIALILFSLPKNVKAVCPPDQGGCSLWTNDVTFPFTSIMCPTCTITLHYDFRICNGVKQIRFRSMYIPYGDPQCNCLTDWLFPNNNLDAIRMTVLAEEGMNKFVWDDFKQNYSATYPCPSPPNPTMRYEEYFPGYCLAWCAGYNVNTGVYKMEATVCTQDGCCLIWHEMCWDVATQTIHDTQGKTVIPGAPCTGTQDLLFWS